MSKRFGSTKSRKGDHVKGIESVGESQWGSESKSRTNKAEMATVVNVGGSNGRGISGSKEKKVNP